MRPPPTPRTTTEDDLFSSYPQGVIELLPLSSKDQSSSSPVPILATDAHSSPTAPPHRDRDIFRSLWITSWLPLVSFTYLIFCYVAHYRPIKIRVLNVVDPIDHFAIVKAGVTSLSILIITLALLPIRSLISDLRSEEFFRVLRLRENGIALSTINSISSPSFGTMATISAVIRRKCSSVFAGALFATFAGVIASTLAPAALSVRTVYSTGEVMAYRVGAVFRNTVWNSTDEGVFLSTHVRQKLNYAATVPWMDLVLDVPHRWTVTSDEQYAYEVPTPLDVPLNARVRYLTDVIRVHPTCSWLAPDSYGTEFDTNLEIRIFNFTTASSEGVSLRFWGSLANNRVLSTRNSHPFVQNELGDLRGNPLIDGTTVIMLGECQVNCEEYHTDAWTTTPEAKINMNSLPTISQDTTAYSGNQTWILSFLICSPNASVEVREVETNGKAGITVIPGENKPARPRQGNLDLTQTKILLGQALIELETSGPQLETLAKTLGLGGLGQLSLVFGERVSGLFMNPREGITLEQAILTPLPIENITRNYARVLHDAMKVFLDGSLGVSYVPGRAYSPTLIFSSSLPHVIVSTIVFFLLSVFLVVCHYRTPVPNFTFFHVATALAGSECPALFEDTASKILPGKAGDVQAREDKALSVVGNQKLIMDQSVGKPDGTIRIL